MKKLRKRILSVTKKDFTIQTFRAGEEFPELIGPCDVWKGALTSKGYGSITINRKTESAHRLFWEKKYGTIPRNKFVLHKCDNPRCVNVDHLFLGNTSANMKDCENKGRRNISNGSSHWSAKLSMKQVKEIRKRSSKEEGKALAVEFGISRAVVSKIINNKAWKAKQHRPLVRIIHMNS